MEQNKFQLKKKRNQMKKLKNYLNNNKCPIPNCPSEEEDNWDKIKKYNDLNCICNKPLLISLQPGQHLHCKVHPDRIFKQFNAYWLG